MSTDYTAEALTAKSLISDFGVYGYIKIKRLSGTFDPVAGTHDGVTSTHDLTAVNLTVTKSLVGGIIEATDNMVIMSNDVVPEMSDILVIGDDEFKPVQIIPINPAGTAVVYKVVCRA